MIEAARSPEEIARLNKTLVALTQNRLQSFSNVRRFSLRSGCELFLGIVIDLFLACTLWRLLYRRWHVSVIIGAFSLIALVTLLALAVIWTINPTAILSADVSSLAAQDLSRVETSDRLLTLASETLSIEIGLRYFSILWLAALALLFLVASVAGWFAYYHIRSNVTEGNGVIIQRV